MGILLVPGGEVDPKVFDILQEDLHEGFGKQVWVGKGMPEPDYAFNKGRN
jgi:hypothetical protein